MTDGNRDALRGLGLALGATAVAFAIGFGRHAFEWRGPRATTTGKVLGCDEHYDSEDGEVYTNSFTFTDASGREFAATTHGLHYCLPAGHGINLEYPVRNPSKARPLAAQ